MVANIEGTFSTLLIAPVSLVSEIHSLHKGKSIMWHSLAEAFAKLQFAQQSERDHHHKELDELQFLAKMSHDIRNPVRACSRELFRLTLMQSICCVCAMP